MLGSDNMITCLLMILSMVEQPAMHDGLDVNAAQPFHLELAAK